jgi:hypothetical protein
VCDVFGGLAGTARGLGFSGVHSCIAHACLCCQQLGCVWVLQPVVMQCHQLWCNTWVLLAVPVAQICAAAPGVHTGATCFMCSLLPAHCMLLHNASAGHT